MTERTVLIDGPYCPFLTCTEPIPHSRPICPDCRAVRYGNLFCATCRGHRCPHGKPEDVCIDCHPDLVADSPYRVPEDFARRDAERGRISFAELRVAADKQPLIRFMRYIGDVARGEAAPPNIVRGEN